MIEESVKSSLESYLGEVLLRLFIQRPVSTRFAETHACRKITHGLRSTKRIGMV